MPHPIDSFFLGGGEINWISFDKKNDAPPNQVGGQLGAFIHKIIRKIGPPIPQQFSTLSCEGVLELFQKYIEKKKTLRKFLFEIF